MSVTKKQLDEKQGRAKRPGSKKKVEWQGFVNCPLDKGDKDALAAYVETSEIVISDIIAIVENGFKFGLRLNEKDGSFIATFMDCDVSSNLAGFMLSAFGSSASNATLALIYKHNYKWRAGWVLPDASAAVDDFG